jgi:CheY-like chemotaxis protein
MDRLLPLVYGRIVSKRVLIVDDDDDVREVTQDVMERHGYEVIAVSSGAEALAFLDFETPGLVLLDLHMEDMTGWEVLGALKSQPRFARTQVVVVTGSAERVSPPTRVLRKPFKIDALLELLEERPREKVAS